MPTLSTKPGPEVGLEEEEECTFPCWRTLPDHIVLHIFSFLGASTLAKTGLVCKAWLRVAFDELLWKDLFYRHWGISRSIPMAPGKYSWIQEYKRLLYHTPSVESEVLKQHADQVLHVSFSHNGKMFATCSKDGFIRVWDATYPTSIKFKADMRKFTWKYTQFSQFNSTDTLLLVSGVHFGSLSTSGEIAVFSLEGEFVMQSRVMNKPYDVFGTWYNDYYLLSGNLHWTGHLNSCSAIWLNKAYQETMSEEESVVMRLFKFSNINASSIRTIMIANCLSKETDIPSGEDKSIAEDVDGSSIVLPPMIGDLITNQEEEDSNEQAEEPNDAEKGKEEMDPNRMEKKTSKSLQRMQVFENGEFITKFLEVDADEPNNKLNGTIEYSSDYRLAEGPKSHTKKGIHGDTSGSELSTNGNHSSSEVSSMNGSSDVFDQSHSSLDVDMGAKSSRSDIEDSQSEQMLSVRRQSRQPSPNESEHVQFMLADVAPLATEEKLDLLVLGQRYDQGPLGSKLERLSQWSVESQLVQSQSVEFNDFSSEDFSTCQSHPLGLADTSTETITGEPLETPSERIAETASEAAGYKSSPKRVLHGQQQQHGELFRNPSTCEVECKTEVHPCSGTPSSSSDSLELPEKTPRLAFCCVDYKKQKKNESLRHTQSRNASSGRYSKNKLCLGRDFVETVEDLSVSEEKDDCVQSKSDNSSRNLQSRMCLGRQSVETIEDEPGSEVKMENGQCRAQSKISTNEENQSGSDVGIDCVPGRVQSRICAGIGTASTENMEYQSSDNDIKVKCKPVRNTCSMQSDTTSVTLSSSSSQSKVYKSAGSAKTFQYKTKKSKKGKSRKIKDKYLIFTKGSETYTPHQIGIKRIKPFQAFSDDGSRLLPNVSENTHQLDRENDIYDEVDHLIDMHGHIIGMTLSPDHRYLYVNSRPWPKNYHIENPLYPPPIAQEIDIHVIDLLNMREVGTMHRAHKAYTSNDECFFIFLDVCEEYVASGAEDKHGYLWDRHYGLCLHKYPHTDVVNSVAFNPADPEVLVTVSDDFSIKIWRSLSREKEVVKAFNKEHSIRVKHVQALMSDTSEYDENVFGGEEKT